jgi:hypothetical protein
MFRRRPVSRNGDGTYRLRLSNDERDVLRGLPDMLRRMLADDEPGLARLFPPAYIDDLERDAEYRKYMRGELVNRRLESLAVVDETIDAERLSEEQLTAWMKVLNDLRLVLGTSLDVKDDDDGSESLAPDDPKAPMMSLYWFLSYLLEATIEALSS